MVPASPTAKPQGPAPGAGDDAPLRIGLVNNMPDAALRTTERQFRGLIAAAGEGRAVSLRLFSVPQLPRGEAGRLHVSRDYEDIEALWEAPLDGLIVTGTAPRAAQLTDEPYWPALTRLVDWADRHTVSTVWSCLAAHAAVLHLDGIERHALGGKLSGAFDCVRIADHPIVAGMPGRWRVPHSRYNALPEAALAARGYRILSNSPEAGVDTFVRQGDSLFLFIQGHPEYDPGALYREYRRDVGRFLAGERRDYPDLPRNCFDERMTAALAAFRQGARPGTQQGTQPGAGGDALAGFPEAADGALAHPWREPAVRLYANWLSYLAAQRSSSRTTAWPHPLRESA